MAQFYVLEKCEFTSRGSRTVGSPGQTVNIKLLREAKILLKEKKIINEYDRPEEEVQPQTITSENIYNQQEGLNPAQISRANSAKTEEAITKEPKEDGEGSIDDDGAEPMEEKKKESAPQIIQVVDPKHKMFQEMGVVQKATKQHAIVKFEGVASPVKIVWSKVEVVE